MNPHRDFGPEILTIDAEQEVDRVTTVLREYLRQVRRKGVVVGLSGGIDSSVVAALAVHALGPEHVFGLHMPERDSADETLAFSQEISDALGIESVVEDLTPVLDAFGCYQRRDDAIRMACPEFGPGHRAKIVLPSVVDSDRYRLYSVVVLAPDGTESQHRLSPEAYLGIVAATNFKQRARATLGYYHADRLNYIVGGTPNRLEYDQGFFVKLGDGSADIKPIAHLYKTQVYQLAEHLGLPASVCRRPSTTDTYSLPQSQEEFYFSLPHGPMDLCLYAKNHDVPVAVVCEATGLTEEQVKRVWRDIDQKRQSTEYLHRGPELVTTVDEVGHPIPGGGA